MIVVSVPDNFLPERKYIIDVLFGEYLGLAYEIRSSKNIMNYEIDLENGNSLIISDSFFGKCNEELGYLLIENIPKSVEYINNEYLSENDLPVIYGGQELKIENSESQTIFCGVDVFASSFFMLTRWEEYVIKSRDKYDRFPYTESLAFKQNFLARPIVNEYLEFLWNMLVELKCPQKRKIKEFRLIVTHDIDSILKWISFKTFLKSITGDIVIRRNPKMFFKNTFRYILFKFGKFKDYYDTFDLLLDLSERAGIKSYFFIMAGGTSLEDNYYPITHPKLKSIFQNINERGHFIGIHPSYNSYNNIDQFKEELVTLNNHSPQSIKFGRQHYLRFDVPITWQIWEDMGMEWDSSMYYSEFVGYRAGTCWEYSVFNLLSREKLKLKERPLLFMETSFNPLIDADPIGFENKAMSMLNQVKKYNGDFVLLWHNSNFYTNNWDKYAHVYGKILNNAQTLSRK